MKLFYVVILGLALTTNFARANETEKNDDMTLSCSVKTDANCNKEIQPGHTTQKGKNKDWTEKRLEQVAAVLPQPVPDKSKADQPSMVKIISPKFLSNVNGSAVKLEWTPSDNVKIYHVQVSTDAGFNNRSLYVVNNNAVAETSIEVKNLEPKTKYFWRVAAYNGDMKPTYTKSLFASSVFTTK